MCVHQRRTAVTSHIRDPEGAGSSLRARCFSPTEPAAPRSEHVPECAHHWDHWHLHYRSCMPPTPYPYPTPEISNVQLNSSTKILSFSYINLIVVISSSSSQIIILEKYPENCTAGVLAADRGLFLRFCYFQSFNFPSCWIVCTICSS